MPVTVLVAVLVPVAAVSVPVSCYGTGCRGLSLTRVASRLQTVIIMVVLLAVAGAVAGVLLTRGGEAVSDIERQQVAREPSDFSTETLSALCRTHVGFPKLHVRGTRIQGRYARGRPLAFVPRGSGLAGE